LIFTLRRQILTENPENSFICGYESKFTGNEKKQPKSPPTEFFLPFKLIKRASFDKAAAFYCNSNRLSATTRVKMNEQD
jgi:hypothetical protein